MLASESVEQLFLPLLQREIAVVFKNKTIKSGKLLLATLKSNYITLYITDESKSTSGMKLYELPYAFKYTPWDTNTLQLSYEIDALCNDNNSFVDLVNKILVKVKKPHRFLGNIVTIKVVDNA